MSIVTVLGALETKISEKVLGVIFAFRYVTKLDTIL